MLSPELIAEIKALELRARRVTTQSMAGEYASAFHGQGMEFDKVREYVVGDDVRAIDWNVTARTNVPHVKVYREERELTIILAIDVSPSMAASSGKALSTMTRELAAVLAYLAIGHNDRVGLMLFADDVECYVPPKKGKAHVWRLIKELTVHRNHGRKSNLTAALNQLQVLQKRRATCFILSDFLTSDFSNELTMCAKQHDITCVYPKKNLILPDAGVVQWIDSESGELLLIDTSDPFVRQSYQDAASKQNGELIKLFDRSGVEHFGISSEKSVVRSLAAYFREREHHRYGVRR